MRAAAPVLTSRASAVRSRSVTKKSADSRSIATEPASRPRSGALIVNQTSAIEAAKSSTAQRPFSCFLYLSKDLIMNFSCELKRLPGTKLLRRIILQQMSAPILHNRRPAKEEVCPSCNKYRKFVLQEFH